MPATFVAWVSSGSLSGQWLHCILGVRLRMSSWLLLGSAFGVVAFVCFPIFPLPPLPIQGRRSLSSVVFPLNSLFSVTSAWFGVWGGGWGSWLGCGLSSLMGCSTDRPVFGLLVSVPRSLSIQPTFATQTLVIIYINSLWRRANTQNVSYLKFFTVVIQPLSTFVSH